MNIKPKPKIGTFVCTFSKTIKVDDILFERKGKPLKDKGIGLRVRKKDKTLAEITDEENDLVAQNIYKYLSNTLHFW